MLVTMKPARGRNSSPLWHSTLATTRRASVPTPGTIQKSSHRITGRFGGLPTGPSLITTLASPRTPVLLYPHAHTDPNPLRPDRACPNNPIGAALVAAQTPVPYGLKSARLLYISVSKAPRTATRSPTPHIRIEAKWNTLKRFFGPPPAHHSAAAPESALRVTMLAVPS